MSEAVNRELYDPRWAGPLDRFANATGPVMPAGYAIVYDRPSNELAVTIRALEDNAAGPADYAYFALATADATVARAVRIPLAPAGMAGDPRPLMQADGFAFVSGEWSEEDARPEWVQRTSAWLSTEGVAWAVSFRVSLDAAGAGLGESGPLRIAIGAHVDGGTESASWTTPSMLSIAMPLDAQPRFWTSTDLASLGCTARIALD